jgi:hypothetical protein
MTGAFKGTNMGPIGMGNNVITRLVFRKSPKMMKQLKNNSALHTQEIQDKQI